VEAASPTPSVAVTPPPSDTALPSAPGFLDNLQTSIKESGLKDSLSFKTLLGSNAIKLVFAAGVLIAILNGANALATNSSFGLGLYEFILRVLQGSLNAFFFCSLLAVGRAIHERLGEKR
jgi:hypothetical protein